MPIEALYYEYNYVYRLYIVFLFGIRTLKSKPNLKSIFLLTMDDTMRRFYLYYIISLVVFYIIYFLFVYPVLEQMYPGSLFLFLPIIIIFPFFGVSKNRD